MRDKDEYTVALEALIFGVASLLSPIDPIDAQAVEKADVVGRACDEMDANSKHLEHDNRGLRRQ